jgi:arylsulfatase A-like enzyme
MSDQHRADCLGAAGNPILQTPSLDRLAREGTLCSRAYVQNPICMPSRSTLFTGRYPRSHRVRTNGVPLPTTEITIADVLTHSGYHTASFGKLHFTPTAAPPEPHLKESTQLWRDRPDELAAWHGPYYGLQHVDLSIGHNLPAGHYGAWLRREHPDALPLFKQDAALQPPTGAHGSWKSAVPVELHASTWIADRTIDYLQDRSTRDQPFFAVCSFPDPHHPFAPPAPYADMYDPADVPMPHGRGDELGSLPPHFREHFRGAWSRQGPTHAEHPEGLPEAHLREIMAHYYGMISLVDHSIGRVLDTLDRTGLAENTLVLFTSDHGELLGDHGLLLKGPFLYEGLVRIPLIWRLPGRIRAGATLDHVAGHVDVTQTILDFLGVDAPAGVQGQSLAGALETGETAGLRLWQLTEYHTGFDPDLTLKQLHTGRYKLTYYGHPHFGELFDLQSDPHEERNLFHDPASAGLRHQLTTMLLDALMATEDPLPPQISFA